MFSVGKSWAIIFARAGYNVNLFDVIPDAAKNAIVPIENSCKELEQYGLLKQSKTPEEVVKRVHPHNDLHSALKDSIWVQECVPEDKESKLYVY